MPRYQLTGRTYINDSLREPGEIVEYGGWPGSSLEPLDDTATAIKAFYIDARKRGRALPKVPDLEKILPKAGKSAGDKPAKVTKDPDDA
jgi:hypothetical protein